MSRLSSSIDAGTVEGHEKKKTYTRAHVIERRSAIYIAIVVVIIARRCTRRGRQTKASRTTAASDRLRLAGNARNFSNETRLATRLQRATAV